MFDFLYEGVFMYVSLIIGFFFLIKGADLFVDGSSSVARLLRVPSIIIGLTIVAMGTSAPETAVSISAALQNANSLSISNVIGSNFFNLLVVTGICAVIKPVIMTKDLMKRDFPFSIAVTFILLALLGITFIGGGGMTAPTSTNATLTAISGAVMLVLFAAYLVVLVKSALSGRASDDGGDIAEYSAIKSILLILIGLAGVTVGSQLVVNSSKEIARAFGLSETLIGLTIVAVGTSLPELVTSIVASAKGQNDLALGNVVGSNIFNILLVLGLSAVLSPIVLEGKYSLYSIIDLIILIAVNIITFAIALKGKRLSRGGGIFMILMYIAYMAYIIPRN